MTPEKRIRRILEGFINDPPDTDYQQGFLAAVIVIGHEIMGISMREKLMQDADALVKSSAPDILEAFAKAKHTFTVIDGGKSQ